MLQRWLLKIQVYLLSHKKPKLRDWCNREDRKYDFIQAVEDSKLTLPQTLFGYLSTALFVSVDFSKIPWQDVFEAFYKIHSASSDIRKIPITANQDKRKGDKDVWDYSGRLFYLYANIIASAYGWSDKAIANLPVNDALAYLQEILTDRQLEKEFIWQTTEIAYSYDNRTKKSKFLPLERPYWMIKPKEIRKAPAVPKSLLPVGNVIRIGRNETKKVES